MYVASCRVKFYYAIGKCDAAQAVDAWGYYHCSYQRNNWPDNDCKIALRGSIVEESDVAVLLLFTAAIIECRASSLACLPAFLFFLYNKALHKVTGGWWRENNERGPILGLNSFWLRRFGGVLQNLLAFNL